jgi:hypothetical protein
MLLLSCGWPLQMRSIGVMIDLFGHLVKFVSSVTVLCRFKVPPNPILEGH